MERRSRPSFAFDALRSRHRDANPSLMRLAMTMLAATALPAASRPSTPFDFSRSYVVWIAQDRGRCMFFVTDVGEDARQITDTLRRHSDPAAGIEILTQGDTPAHCVAMAQRAVKKAGFSHFRVRLGADADRSPGIP